MFCNKIKKTTEYFVKLSAVYPPFKSKRMSVNQKNNHFQTKKRQADIMEIKMGEYLRSLTASMKKNHRTYIIHNICTSFDKGVSL